MPVAASRQVARPEAVPNNPSSTIADQVGSDAFPAFQTPDYRPICQRAGVLAPCCGETLEDQNHH